MAMMRTTIKKKKSSPSKNACRLIGLVFFLEKWKVDFLLVSTKLEYFIFRKKVCQFFFFFEAGTHAFTTAERKRRTEYYHYRTYTCYSVQFRPCSA